MISKRQQQTISSRSNAAGSIGASNADASDCRASARWPARPSLFWRSGLLTTYILDCPVLLYVNLFTVCLCVFQMQSCFSLCIPLQASTRRIASKDNLVLHNTGDSHCTHHPCGPNLPVPAVHDHPAPTRTTLSNAKPLAPASREAGTRRSGPRRTVCRQYKYSVRRMVQESACVQKQQQGANAIGEEEAVPRGQRCAAV